MFVPYCRGGGSWVERQRSIEYMCKTEQVHLKHLDYAPDEDGLSLPIGDLAFQHLSSEDFLKVHFADRYNPRTRTLKTALCSLEDAKGPNLDGIIQLLGPEFDFSISLYLEQRYLSRQLKVDSARINEETKLFDLIKYGDFCYVNNDFPAALKNYQIALRKEHRLYRLLFRVALMYLDCSERINEIKACQFFSLAAEQASHKQDHVFSSICLLHAGFTSYLLNRDQQAMEYALKAIFANNQLAESYYLYAKVASMHDPCSAAIKIRSAVALAPYYCLKAVADQDMLPLHAGLVQELRDQAEKRSAADYKKFRQMRERMLNVQRSIKEHAAVIGQSGMLRDLFDMIDEHFEQAESIYNRKTFFDYQYFLTCFKRIHEKWENPMLDEMLSDIFISLKDYSARFTDLDKKIKQTIFRRRITKLLSFLMINILFLLLFFKVKKDWNLSDEWLTLIPIFCTFMIAIAWIDIVLSEISKFLHTITLKTFPLKTVSAYIERLNPPEQTHYFPICLILTVLFLLSILLSLARPLSGQSLTLFLLIVMTITALLAYRANSILFKDYVYRMRVLEKEISQYFQHRHFHPMKLGL